MHFRDEKILTEFGTHLKNLRRSAGITQEELAFTSGISLSQIARIETGRINPTICTVITLSKYLRVPQHEMLNF